MAAALGRLTGRYFALDLLDQYFEFQVGSLLELVDCSASSELVERAGCVEFAKVNALFREEDRLAPAQVRAALEDYSFLPEKAFKVSRLGDSEVAFALTVPKALGFLARPACFEYLVAVLVKSLRADAQLRELKSQSLSAVYALEKKLLSRVLKKFFVFSMRRFDFDAVAGDKSVGPAEAWERTKAPFNALYREALHHLKTNKFALADKPAHYSALMNIELAYRFFERC